ncbi:MAG TPA: cellulase family glycosylhydrolase [Verrucomicrobiae bacterium]|nr:cellulase family glycosylhydrolase [Verrucomicrobiae bacterium]
MLTKRSLQLFWSALLVALLMPLPAAAAVGYYTQSGRMYDAAGQEVQLRGVSHYGFNADILQPQFLWSMGWKEQIAQIKALGFNAVRVPFVPDTLYVTTKVDELSYVDPVKNADLIGKTPLQVLDLWMAEANRQGLYVMLDFHSVSKVRQFPTWFLDAPSEIGNIWNRQAYTEQYWLRDLRFVAQRYAHLPRFIAIDIFNEPNGKVRWSTGDPNMTDSRYFWKPAVEKAASAILQANPKLLIFVQGIVGNYDGIEDNSVPINWGENFRPHAYQPLNVPYDKLVLSPHTYGPDVYLKSSFSAINYPSNLAANWDALFGKFYPQHPVVAGEWGGRYGQGGTGEADVAWQDAFVAYMQSRGIRSSFYWCYTPNSGDTGGILTDALEVREDKMALLRRHWGASSSPTPQPTTPPPSGTSGALAFSAGSYGVAQDAGTVTLMLNRTGGAKGAVSVSYATASGTARSGTDFTTRRGVASWADGDTAAKKVRVLISNTTPFTGTRSFSMVLSAPTGGAALGSVKSATVTITGSKTSTSSSSSSGAPQPYISNFSPASGPIGTLVTLNGWGFTGLTHAWVGAAHNAGVQVVSDTQARVIIPSGATTGAIGLFNSEHVSFTATSFTVTK